MKHEAISPEQAEQLVGAIVESAPDDAQPATILGEAMASTEGLADADDAITVIDAVNKAVGLEDQRALKRKAVIAKAQSRFADGLRHKDPLGHIKYSLYKDMDETKPQTKKSKSSKKN